MNAVNPVEAAVRHWIETVVIGLNLCPFAARPFRAGQVRIHVSDCTDELELLTELQLELTRLDETPAAELETTIIAIPRMLADFLDYNDFLDRVDDLLEQFGWVGEYQLASFHPQYQFAGTQADDAENLTNRSPVPLLHILRDPQTLFFTLFVPVVEFVVLEQPQVFEAKQLVRHDRGKALNTGDAVTCGGHTADLYALCVSGFVGRRELVQRITDVVGVDGQFGHLQSLLSCVVGPRGMRGDRCVVLWM